MLSGFNISREMTNRPLDIFLMKPTHMTKTYACSISYESSYWVETEFKFALNIYDQCSASERW